MAVVRGSDIGPAPLLEPHSVRDREGSVLPLFPIPPPLFPANPLLVALLRKLLIVVPVVVAPRVMQLVDEALDPETPVLRRALIFSIAFEALAFLQVSIPLGAALRCALLASVFKADKGVSRKQDIEPVRST